MNLIDSNWWEFTKTAVIPVFIFFLGFLLSLLVTHCTEKRRLRKVKEYFISLVDLQYDVAKKQALRYDECALACANMRSKSYMIGKMVGDASEAIKGIDKQDLYEIFVKNKDIDSVSEDFASLLSALQYIDHSISTIDDQNKIFKDKEDDLIRKWNEYQANTKNQVNILRDIDEEHIKGLIEIWTPYINAGLTGGFSPEDTYNLIIIKSLEYLNTVKKDPRLIPIINDLIWWKSSHINLSNLYKSRQFYCQNMSVQLNEVVKNMQAILRDFD